MEHLKVGSCIHHHGSFQSHAVIVFHRPAGGHMLVNYLLEWYDTRCAADTGKCLQGIGYWRERNTDRLTHVWFAMHLWQRLVEVR